MSDRLKYLGYAIVFQEIPDEVSLAINISGCPHHCEGCHSKYLWEYRGNFIGDDIESIVERYKNFITCVCFMGGDQNFDELVSLAKYVRSCGLKAAIYTGLDDISSWGVQAEVFDFIKFGRYESSFGGLDCKTTNQKMIQLHPYVSDITYKFW